MPCSLTFALQSSLIEDDPATVHYNSIALAYILTLYITKIIELGMQNRDCYLIKRHIGALTLFFFVFNHVIEVFVIILFVS